MKPGFVFRGLALALLGLATVPACAEAVPQSALTRCKLGMSDGNDVYTVRQSAACRIVAQALASDDKPVTAVSFARKACDMQDPSGCVLYLTLSRAQPTELTRARTTGEKACDGMVVSSDGTDARPRLCFLAAELYDELEPRSADEAAHLYAKACKLGDERACPRAKALGVDPDAQTAAAKPAPAPAPRPAPTPPPPPSAPTAAVVSQVMAPACHEMKPCVSLELQQHNTSEVVGTMTNKCDHTALCHWCPSKGSVIDKTQCHSGTLAPGETRTGTQWGLWYDGYNAMAYDCTEEHDPPQCLAL
jgi:hypothetical protein